MGAHPEATEFLLVASTTTWGRSHVPRSPKNDSRSVSKPSIGAFTAYTA